MIQFPGLDQSLTKTQTKMKICFAVLSIVLLQGALVHCQSSTLSSIASSVSSAYQQYRSGSLLSKALEKAREYIRSALESLSKVQNFLSQLQVPQLPQIPQVPQVPQAPSQGQGRSGSWNQWRSRP